MKCSNTAISIFSGIIWTVSAVFVCPHAHNNPDIAVAHTLES